MPQKKTLPKTAGAAILLFDLVNFSPQAEKAGPKKTTAFLERLAANITKLAAQHKIHFVKTNGDGFLLYAGETDTLVPFVHDFFFRKRIKETADFTAAFRLIVHWGAVTFTRDAANKVTDLTGTPVTITFRLEKYASRDRVLVTQPIFDLIQDQLSAKDILWDSLDLPDALKGIEGDSPRRVHILTPPLPASLLDTKLPLPLRTARETLRNSVQFIPVFGGLYPAIPMSADFLNLSLDRQKTKGSAGYYEFTLPDFEERAGADRAGKRRAPDTEKTHLPNFDRIGARDLFRYVRKGVIAGLPGAGKTTILRHFIYRALDTDPHAVIVFAEAKHLRPSHLKFVAEEKLLTPEGILLIATALFLFPGVDPASFSEPQRHALKLSAAAILHAWENAQSIILFDALDEATGEDLRTWLSRAADVLTSLIKTPTTPKEVLTSPPRACFLTLRVAELGSYQFANAPLFLVNPLEYGQITDIAERRYGEDAKRFIEFKDNLLKRSDIIRIAGTPLTAMLMVFYFQVYGRFDTRHATYQLLMRFILAKAWESIKEGTLGLPGSGMDTFFVAARLPGYDKNNPQVAMQYRALGYAATCVLYESERTRKASTERSVFVAELRELIIEGGIPPSDAGKWIAAWRRENFLLPAGPHHYVPLHSTLFEFLAAEHIISHLDDKRTNSRHAIATAFSDPERDHLEALPIACSADPDTACRILARLGDAAKKNKSRFTRKSTLPFRCLSAVESIEAAELKHRSNKRLSKNLVRKFDSAIGKSWAYKHLAAWFSSPSEVEARKGEDASLHPLVKITRELEWLDALIRDLDDCLTMDRGVVLEKQLRKWQNKGNPISLKQAELFSRILSKDAPKALWNRINIISRMGPGLSESDAFKALETYLTLLKMYRSATFADAVRKEYDSLPKILRTAPADGETAHFLGLDLPGHEWDNNLAYHRTRLAERNIRSRDTLVAPPKNAKRQSPHDTTQNNAAIRNFADGDKSVAAPYIPQAELLGFLGSPNMRASGAVLALMLSKDERVATSVDSSGTILTWDIATGRELHRCRISAPEIVCCAIAKDGQNVVTSHSDNTLRLWNTHSGIALRTFTGHIGTVWCCAISEDGTRIVSGSRDNTLRLWDAHSGIMLHTLSGHTDTVWSCAITENGTRIVSGSQDNTLRLWDANSGTGLRTFNGHKLPVICCAISEDGTRIVSGSRDNTLRLWDAHSGIMLHTLSGHTGTVMSCAISKDGTRIISGSWDYTIFLWNADSGIAQRTLSGHTSAVMCCAILQGGSRIVSGSQDNTLRLWNAHSGTALGTLAGHTDTVWSCAISEDGTRIVSGSWDNTLRLWDAHSGTALRTLFGHTDAVWCCAISEDETRIVSGSADKTFRLWDADSGTELRTLTGHKGTVWCCAISKDGTRIVSGSEDNTLRLWDVPSGNELRTLSGHTGTVRCCAFTPDQSRIASGSTDGTLRLWDVESGKLLETYDVGSEVYGISMHARAKLKVVLALSNGTCMVLEISSAI